MTITDHRTTAPRRSALDRTVARELAMTEQQRFATLLAGLPGDAWGRPTDCPAWDVRQMSAHVLGMAHMAASLRDQLRQQRKAKRAGGDFLDALTALQVAERAGMTPDAIVADLRRTGPKAVRARFRTPALVRRRTLPQVQTVGGRSEAWTFGFLLETILTRDVWMHRIDVTRATGAELHLTAEHDGVLVGDVVREWAERHGRPCTLLLTGPAGGSWTFGAGGPELELDAVEAMRTFARRAPATGLLDVEVPF